MRRTLCPTAALLLLLLAPACVPDETTGDEGTSGSPDATADVGDLGIQPDTSSVDAGPDTSPDAQDATDHTGPSDRPVDERGPHHVGFSKTEVVYQAEEDGTDEDRTLDLLMWYPTDEQEGPSGKYHVLLKRDEVVQNAAPISGGEMPVMLFSHGNGGIPAQNYFMTEYWASHGWAVVSPEHEGNTLSDGTAINLEAAVYRPQDVTATLDHLENLDEDNPLAGRLSDQIAMSGHSFGGYTTLANSGAEFDVDDLLDRCEQEDPGFDRDYCDVFAREGRIALFREGFHDERIDVAIPMTPAGNIIFDDGLEQLAIPTMLMTGGEDQTLPNEQEGDPIWEQMVGEQHRRINLPEGGHFTFSNMCDFDFADTQPRLAGDGCGEEFVEPERAYDLINVYALAFARHHLFGDEEAGEIVDGERYPVGDENFDLSIGAE